MASLAWDPSKRGELWWCPGVPYTDKLVCTALQISVAQWETARFHLISKACLMRTRDVPEGTIYYFPDYSRHQRTSNLRQRTDRPKDGPPVPQDVPISGPRARAGARGRSDVESEKEEEKESELPEPGKQTIGGSPPSDDKADQNPEPEWMRKNAVTQVDLEHALAFFGTKAVAPNWNCLSPEDKKGALLQVHKFKLSRVIRGDDGNQDFEQLLAYIERKERHFKKHQIKGVGILSCREFLKEALG